MCVPTCPVMSMCELDHRVQCMASNIVVESSCHEWSSYVRSYRLYQAVWIPAMDEMLRLAVEPTNSHNMYAVAVMQVGCDGTVRVVGHLPRNASRVISFFIKKNGSIGYSEVTGERTNRGSGLGLESSCIYGFVDVSLIWTDLRTCCLSPVSY